jgi:hypothetical protein
MTERTATCACGALQIACRGEPQKVSLCHCRECQRRTGGPFGVAAFYAADSVEVSGEATVYSRPSDTGFEVVHRFCPGCGSTVWWEATRKPGLVAVALGAFADPEFPGPSQSVRAETRHRWLPEDFL